jgi:hypothetical protein
MADDKKKPKVDEPKTAAEKKAEAKAAEERLDYWTKRYLDAIGVGARKFESLSKEAKELIRWAAQTKQMPSIAAFLERMREADPDSYLLTKPGKTRATAARDLLRDVLKGQFNLNDKEIKALIVKFAIGDPTKLTDSNFFRRYVMHLDSFKTAYAGFAAWWRQRTGVAATAGGDTYQGFVKWQQLRDAYVQDYQSRFGSAAVIPDELLNRALMGNWALDSPQWNEALLADPSWSGVESYQQRVEYFKDQWNAIFAGTEYEDMDPPSALMHKFGANKNLEWSEVFQTSIRDSEAFRSAFPDFEAFAEASFKRTGMQPGTIQINDYFRRRADYIEIYKGIMEDPDAMPDSAVLGEALANNWSDTQWELSVKKNDPQYKNSPASKNRGVAFDNYWKRVFGENSVPDGGLRDEFIRGTLSEPSSMWEQIKGTSEFRSQYSMWETFAAAQNAQGNVVMDDPGLYKKYQKAFYDAFANQGIQVPGGFDRMFFASGIDPGDFAQNIEQFSEQGEAYKWQSGEQADLATTAGIGDKTAGGDLRKKLSDAIRQHQTFAQSKFTNFRMEEKSDKLAQKI